ncbi:DUF2877 domain-containing protein [Streptomyces vietnamensis]|uniref:oxamate carbamoyltransferase subunit AllH family protein n=1 Tax=Streptomyces vietnamensis TaxID=362257 RepID=UPI0006976F9E|nr:DUF2877 domain-containing protein [Streptomyces vietnamensis]
MRCHSHAGEPRTRSGDARLPGEPRPGSDDARPGSGEPRPGSHDARPGSDGPRLPGTLRPRSGDARLLGLLRGLSGTGSVHSVFSRVVNLLTPDGTLIALAARDGGDAPRTLVLDVAAWTGQGLEAGRSVVFSDGTLTVDRPRPLRPLFLTTAGARPWHAVTPSLAALPPGGFAAAAVLLDRLCRTYGPLGGMLGPAPGAGLLETAVARALDEGRTTLVAGVRAGDGDGIRRGVLALLGLGPGLTPAGDDFLTGLALVAALPGSRLAAFVPVLRDVLAEHGARTTALGLATLSEAADGRARTELLDLLRLLAEHRPAQDLNVPVRRVLAIGHTSGGDTLSGLVAGFRLEEELRGPL